MTLYLKYRSQTLEDLDSELVRNVLKKTIKSGNIPHAFLFAGPRGTGKTSAARILAKIINCEKRTGGQVEPCNKCDQCLSITRGSNIDVIEIDAASHRGIDDIRSLRDAVKLSPAKANKKVYIIDEAHMLTIEASNALLKTLEEPPGHVVFILATTNPEKLIETIKSRVVLVYFKKASSNEIVRSLRRIAKGENLELSEDVANLIAKCAKGSFRDSHKFLEQLIADGVDLSDFRKVENILVGFMSSDVDNLINFITNKDVRLAISEIESMVDRGISLSTYMEALVELLHNSLLSKFGLREDPIPQFSREDLVKFFDLMSIAKSQMHDSFIEQIPLEGAVIRMIEHLEKKPSSDNEAKKDNGSRNNAETLQDVGERTIRKSMGDKKNIKAKIKGMIVEQETDNIVLPDKDISDKPSIAKNIFVKEIDEGVWRELLKQIKPKNTSTEALLRAAKPMDFDGKILKLGVYYSFHKERLEESLHNRIVESTLAELIGYPVRILCQLTAPPQKEPKETENHDNGDSESNANITTLTEVGDESIIKLAKEVFENS